MTAATTTMTMPAAACLSAAIEQLTALRRAARAGDWDAVDTAGEKITQRSGEGSGNVALAIIEAGCTALIERLEDEISDDLDELDDDELDELDREAEQ